MISDPGMGPHPTLGCHCFRSRAPANQQSVSRIGVSIASRGNRLRDHDFRHRAVGVVDAWMDF